MNNITIITLSFIAAMSGTLIALFFTRKRVFKDDELSDKISRIAGDALRQNSEQFLAVARENLNSQKSEIKTDLEGKKAMLGEMIAEIRKELRQNELRVEKSETERLKSFTELANELKSYKEITGELKTSTDRLKDLLSNNQLRGAFGEQVAEDLLIMAGFVIGQDYSRNEAQDTVNTRPDFTIFLPDKTKVNIDVKFPYSALLKYTEAHNKQDQLRYLNDFRKDVKDKIRQVCTRDYVNPEEKTVDFVVLFIPNEMIFSFVYEKMNDIWEEAMRKKVILAGPFSFTAVLRMVKQAYTNFRYQENLYQIIGMIQKFDDEYNKFSESVDRLGERLKSVNSQFDLVSTTRDKKLTSIVDKIKSQQISPAQEDIIKLIDNND